jgi:aminopeptidase N/puromycin-sensitive aminopeptidase
VVGLLLRHPWSRRAAWKFVQTRLADIQKRVPEFQMLRIVDATGGFCDADLVGEMQKFWGDKKMPGLQRRLAQASEDAQQCVQLKARERTNLAGWLRQSTPAL